MEMHEIRYALAAARTLNFTRAATDCNVSQPALTAAIKKLEGEFGQPLFSREGKGLVVTRFGQTILPHLQKIAEGAEVAHSVAHDFRLMNQVPLQVGVLGTIGPARLSRLLKAYEDAHPGVEVAVREAGLEELVAGLRAVELDLAILSGDAGGAEGLRLQPIYSEAYVVALPPGHRLADRDAIGLADLSGESYVDRLACEFRETVMSLARERTVTLYAKLRSEREDWVQAMVAAGIGFAFMPEFSVTSPAVVVRPLTDPVVARRVTIATVASRQHPPTVASFIKLARGLAAARRPG